MLDHFSVLGSGFVLTYDSLSQFRGWDAQTTLVNSLGAATLQRSVSGGYL